MEKDTERGKEQSDKLRKFDRDKKKESTIQGPSKTEKPSSEVEGRSSAVPKIPQIPEIKIQPPEPRPKPSFQPLEVQQVPRLGAKEEEVRGRDVESPKIQRDKPYIKAQKIDLALKSGKLGEGVFKEEAPPLKTFKAQLQSKPIQTTQLEEGSSTSVATPQVKRAEFELKPKALGSVESGTGERGTQEVPKVKPMPIDLKPQHIAFPAQEPEEVASETETEAKTSARGVELEAEAIPEFLELLTDPHFYKGSIGHVMGEGTVYVLAEKGLDEVVAWLCATTWRIKVRGFSDIRFDPCINPETTNWLVERKDIIKENSSLMGLKTISSAVNAWHS